MAIRPVDSERCIGCGRCIRACPVDVIRLDVDTNKAKTIYPEDCMCCACCEDDCPVGAIYVSPEKHDPLMVSWR
ncbi:MAG: fdx2 [Oscillospiraceae bacterium]|nr:fdx2 [Oscillospiraceae bacterium]